MVDLGSGHIVVQGQLVSAKIERIVLAIKEYEPAIDVDWIPPGARTEGQAAFRIVYRPVGQPEFILFHVSNEEDFDERVLWRIIHNDQRNGEHNLSEFEAWEATQKAVQHQEYLDKLEEANDVAAHILRTHKNTYKVSNDLIIKDGIPFNAAPRRN